MLSSGSKLKLVLPCVVGFVTYLVWTVHWNVLEHVFN